jgi:hypothetical protein
MNHGPFGLSPQVFSIGFLVAFLGGGTLLSLLMSRRTNYKRTLAATAASYQAQQLPGAQPFGDLVGLWHFKSAAGWVGVICGVVIGAGAVAIPLSAVVLPEGAFDSGDITEALLTAIVSGAVGLLLIVYSLWRPTRAAQQCNVDRSLFITLGRGGREIPLDFRQYRYVRIPRFDEGRIVLFHSRWTTAEGALIGVNRLDDFFIDTCRRAGYEPHFRRTWFTIGRPGWDVTPQ